MEENKLFNFYNKNEVKKILREKERLVFVDDGIDEAVIKYKDLPDFIVDVYEKTRVDRLKVYDFENPNMDKPLLTTIGQFLDKCDSQVRKDIIDRLVKLQRKEINIKKYKIIDEYTLEIAQNELEKSKEKKGEIRDDR